MNMLRLLWIYFVKMAWQERQGLQSIKTLLNVHIYWAVQNVVASMVAILPYNTLVVNTKHCVEEYVVVCLLKQQLGYIIKFIIH